MGRDWRREDVAQGQSRKVSPEREQPGSLRDQQPSAGHAFPASNQPQLERHRPGDYVPDCDLDEPIINSECGAWSNPAFGSPIGSSINPDILHGWGVRPADWQFGVSIQREVPAAHVAGGELQPSLVPELPGDRQSRARSRRCRLVHDHCATASRFAGRRGIHSDLPRSADAGGEQLHDVRVRLRRSDAVLAWLRHQRKRPHAKRPGAAGRDEHRTWRAGVLRCRRQAA